jgi:hypothetical protein
VNFNRTESAIEKTACRQIYAYFGVESLKLNVRSNTGYPDRIFFLPGGRPVFIEFKRPGGILSAKQRYQKKKLEGMGYPVFVAYSESQALHFVKEMGGRTKNVCDAETMDAAQVSNESAKMAVAESL